LRAADGQPLEQQFDLEYLSARPANSGGRLPAQGERLSNGQGCSSHFVIVYHN